MDSLRIVIVGLGLIGGSLAKAFQRRGGCQISGIDHDPTVLEAAKDSGAIDKFAVSSDLANADYLFLCTYPHTAVSFMEQHGSELSPSCTVSDTCGIKNEICPRLTALSRQYGFSFIGGHPMAGKEQSGFAYSEASMFDGASYIMVPCGAPHKKTDALRKLMLSIGFGSTVETTPEHHDAMIAFTSQLPHALACAYVMSPCCPDHRGYSAGSYRDVSRVAHINEELWSELFLENRDALVTELDTLTLHLQQIRDAIEQNDRDKLRLLLRRGKKVKEALGE